MKTFGELKEGDIIYGIANDPFSAKVSAVKLEMRGERMMAVISCPEAMPHGDLVIPSEHHIKEINGAMKLTSDQEFFKRSMEPILRPRIEGMSLALKKYKELMGES